MRQLDSKTFVACRQLVAGDIRHLAARSVALIVNNRPDGEDEDQPTSAEIEAAARAAGLDYRHIPVSGGFNLDDVLAMADALETAQGKALLCCRTGTRSAFLWALARSERGEPSGQLVAAAARAGYDLAPIAAYLG